MNRRLERDPAEPVLSVDGEPASPEAPASECLAEHLEALRADLLSPRFQVRSAVALQIGQLDALSRLLTRFGTVVEAFDASWAAWTDRALAVQEAQDQALRDLAGAQQGQERALQVFRQSLVATRDEDTGRLEAGLRNLAAAVQDLRTATEAVTGTGQRFRSQVQEALQELATQVPATALEAARIWEPTLDAFRRGLRPVVWIGGTLVVLVAADLAVRVMR